MKRWLIGLLLIVMLLFLHHTPAAQGSTSGHQTAGMFQNSSTVS